MGKRSKSKRRKNRKQPTSKRSNGGLKKYERGDKTPVEIRRWNAAENNGLNRERWPYAHGRSINADLDTDLTWLMARMSHEVANNPIFEGVVNTFKRDVVGPEGPMLQIVSDDEQFNKEVERQWRGIFAKPNPKKPTTGGVESMKQWVHLLCIAGAYINRFIFPTRDGLVNFGWKTHHPRRLVTPLKMVGDPNVAFGVRVDDDGDPIEWYIDKPVRQGTHEQTGVDFETLRPDQLQHRYLEVEPEQLAGYPLLASTLETAADIRDLDRAEVKAMWRNAAMSIGLHASNPEFAVDPDPIPGPTFPISDDEATVIPKGWAPTVLDNNRPSPDHIRYRRERIGEYGLPIGMPLLVVMLNVLDANFSAAQFGGMLYADAIRDVQSFLARTTLDELVELVILEVVLGGRVTRPQVYEKVWTHHVPPNANMEKFAKYIRMLLEDGVISRPIATSWLGFDPEKVAESRKRDDDRSDELGIGRAPINAGSGSSRQDVLREVADELDDADDQNDSDQDTNTEDETSDDLATADA